ncbi:uncharacterized protein IL334_003563 [Kwoniella shivajii]|uniref:Uncharacterized protein n=1 Tax=Kwoniella shivajii TaxID=564305 RepID=A0ABZ1CZP1_9TREE|nr:hypothetical protein IL334_003563 [Kwoniella shivajii]
MPNSISNNNNQINSISEEDKARLDYFDNQPEKSEKDDTPTHILLGTHDFSTPNAFVAGTAPPLTARPYTLSKGYSHLVESPEQNRDVIVEKLSNLQSTLAQLGSDDLRQAKADIVYLRSVLEDEDTSIAQIKAGAVWASRDA